MSVRQLPYVRAKHLYRVIDERAGGRLPTLLAVSIHHGVVPRSSLTDGEARADDLSTYKRCEPGDIVLNRMRAFQGAIGVARQSGLVSPDYLVLRPRPAADGRYLHHLFRSRWFVSEMAARLRGIGSVDQGNVRTPRINAEDLGDIEVPLPDTHRQKVIADFLDRETARIDALINAKRRLINLLQTRWRVAVEQRMVTLASEHGTVPLRHLVTCLDGTRVPLSAEERGHRQGPFPYYGASGIVDYVDDYLFDEVLVLLGEDGAQLGDPGCLIAQVVSGKIWVNNHTHVLRPTKVEPQFLAMHLNTFDRVPFISGGTREKITQDDLLSIRVPHVPVADQQLWISQLATWRHACDSATDQIRRQLDLVAEHRQALITAAVTGELDVGVAA